MADSSALTVVTFIATLIIDGVMFLEKLPAVEKFVDESTLPSAAFGPIPDVWFGIANPDDLLSNFFDGLGEEGRDAYRSLSSWDYFPYMESYVILLGSLLVRAARKTGVREEVAYAAPAIMFFDVIENFVLGRACDLSPNSLDANTLLIGTLANQTKWLLFLSCVLFSAGTLVPDMVRSSGSTGKSKKK